MTGTNWIDTGDLRRRLIRHAREYEHTESEPDISGNLVHDLFEAVSVIDKLQCKIEAMDMNLRHSNAGQIS
jgi:hypothetical protein